MKYSLLTFPRKHFSLASPSQAALQSQAHNPPQCIGQQSFPFHIQLPTGLSTVSQIKIDEILVRNPILLRERTKVIDRVFVEADRELFLCLAKIWIFD